ncbi:hypothetical protein [Helicobacter sp. MIT 01-3238]|uniref:hypothetical protein n=1 Tax=Helicobacter sp. MIT 01-3238 TaxID=398627 RepID=UPI000E1EE47C|nr:hypothetical protein [Helicobacter sp. MIT 01-3238]RDU53503.1 hypothetical protein CQA40_05125 [Helicobacter sp. MIT 01-3238]
MKEDLSYAEAITKVMLENGYIAPLKLLYKDVFKYKDSSKIVGKTPIDTIRGEVQKNKKFTRVGLGIYALSDKLDLLQKQETPKTEKEKLASRHGEIQGMLLELGNSLEEVSETYTNDKKFIFNKKPLGSICTLRNVPPFTYEHIIKIAYHSLMLFGLMKECFPQRFLRLKIPQISEMRLLNLWSCKIFKPNLFV